MNGFFLSLGLLFLAFLLKIFINRELKKLGLLKAISELPVDMMFTSITFIIAYRIAYIGKLIREKTVITKELDMNSDFLYLILYLIFTIPVIVLWRFSEKAINESKWKNCTYLIGLAYIISFAFLIIALIKLNGVV